MFYALQKIVKNKHIFSILDNIKSIAYPTVLWIICAWQITFIKLGMSFCKLVYNELIKQNYSILVLSAVNADTLCKDHLKFQKIFYVWRHFICCFMCIFIKINQLIFNASFNNEILNTERKKLNIFNVCSCQEVRRVARRPGYLMQSPTQWGMCICSLRTPFTEFFSAELRHLGHTQAYQP